MKQLKLSDAAEALRGELCGIELHDVANYHHPELITRTGCTSLTASSCPRHGDCTCHGEDTAGCPLHAAESRHAELMVVGGESVGAT
jgi:hypothetical protein